MHRLLFIHAVRPDRFLATAHIFVSSVFGEQFMAQAETVLNLQNVVEHEVKLEDFLMFFNGNLEYKHFFVRLKAVRRFCCVPSLDTTLAVVWTI